MKAESLFEKVARNGYPHRVTSVELRVLCAFLSMAAIGALSAPIATAQADKQSDKGTPATGGATTKSESKSEGKTEGSKTDTINAPSTNAPSTNAPATKAPATPVVTMQLRREITSTFLCRFITPTDATAPLVPLPAPVGTDSVVAVPVPAATAKAKGALLEVVDADHSRIARIPLDTKNVGSLNESSFTLVQTVLVPVIVKGKGGLTAASVTLASDDKSYKQSVTLTPADQGIARFANVPLKKQITATVTEGTNPPISATQTLTMPTSAEGYRWTPAFEVSWADARTVPLPATNSTVPGTISSTNPNGMATPPAVAPSTPTPNNSENPLSGIVSTVVSLLFLGGVGYGIFWAYQKGHIKDILDKLGIQTQPLPANGPQVSPFEKPKAPIVPITEGVADPLSGSPAGVGNYGGVATAPPISTGPRLVATMGTYSGTIFALNAVSMDIGRDPANPIAMPNDTNASRRHATFQVTGGQVAVTDNGSSNGTFVNGVRIPAQSPHPLRSGDEVQVGMTRFRFEA